MLVATAVVLKCRDIVCTLRVLRKEDIRQTARVHDPLQQTYEPIGCPVQTNPEYDHVLFTDADCARFMCELTDPDSRRAYEVREEDTSRRAGTISEHDTSSNTPTRP